MKNDFIKQFYKSDLNFSVHYVYGRNTNSAYSDKLHYDTDLTVAYFKEATGTIKIEGNTYDLASGDIIILNYDELHCVSIESEFCERITLYLNESIYKNYEEEIIDLLNVFYHKKRGEGNIIKAATVQDNGLNILLEEIYNCLTQQSTVFELVALGKITELLSRIKTTQFQNKDSKTQLSTKNSVIDKTIKYINLHFLEEISCDEIAQEMYLNKYYLSKLFKENVGITLWEYIINRRILYFNDLIRQNFSIEYAYRKSGFNNYSNFYRLYKKRIGISPQDFKRNLIKTNEL